MRSGWVWTCACVALLAAPEAAPSDTALVARLAGDFMDIPAGDFRMGDAVGDGDPDEKPLHDVRIEALRVARTEVTRGQFAAFVRATGYRTDAERDAGGVRGCFTMELSSGKWDNHAGHSWRDPGVAQSDSHPVVCVSWNDAQAYIRWLNGETGRTFRLLSEAEWEYVARAGSEARYPWGMDVNLGCRHANAMDRSPWPDGSGRSWPDQMECDDEFFHPAPVGSFQPNDWGLHDLLGNVWEWTEDCYHDSYDGASGDGSSWTSLGCDRRILRGGSWADTPRNLRVSNRFRGAVTLRNDNLGFRLAQDLRIPQSDR